MRLISSAECSAEPQSPGVMVAMWTCQPCSRARRISTPAQRNSASSGWARTLRMVLSAMKLLLLARRLPARTTRLLHAGRHLPRTHAATHHHFARTDAGRRTLRGVLEAAEIFHELFAVSILQRPLHLSLRQDVRPADLGHGQDFRRW